MWNSDLTFCLWTKKLVFVFAAAFIVQNFCGFVNSFENIITHVSTNCAILQIVFFFFCCYLFSKHVYECFRTMTETVIKNHFGGFWHLICSFGFTPSLRTFLWFFVTCSRKFCRQCCQDTIAGWERLRGEKIVRETKREQEEVSDWGVWSRSCCGLIIAARDSHC